MFMMLSERFLEKNKVFLCYFPPGMTNFIQPIDAGLGRSVRISVGNFLDEWLMIGENMERWESKWTAAERRIMISKLEHLSVLVAYSLGYRMKPTTKK